MLNVGPRPLIALLALVWASLAAPAGAAPLPERAPPNGFTSVNGASGGRTLAGTFTGNARSAAAVLGGMLGGLRGYFDGPPVVSSAVGDPARPQRHGVLRRPPAEHAGARRHHGAAERRRGWRRRRHLRPPGRHRALLQADGAPARRRAGPGGGPPQRPVALQQQTTPDGKAAIGVPPGWRISGWGNGAVDVAGPQGQMVDVGIYLPIFSAPTYGGPIPGAVYLPFIADPAQAVRAVSEVQGRQAMARGGQGFTDLEVVEGVATPPPTGSGQAAYMFVRSRLGGRPHLHFALVNTAPIDQRSWAYYYSTVAAPDGVFQRDFALMLNVWRSWSLNQQMLRDRMQDAANKMRQTERDPAQRRPRPERGLRPLQQGLRLLHPRGGGAGEHVHRHARQLRPRLRRRGGQGGPDQIPSGPAEPVPDHRLVIGRAGPDS